MKYREDIICLYEKGLTMEQISSQLVVSLSKIKYVLKESNCNTGNRKYQFTEEMTHLVQLCIMQGIRQKKIADILDISIYTVKDIVKRLHLQHKAVQNRYKGIDIEQNIIKKIHCLYITGYSYLEIREKIRIDDTKLIHALSCLDEPSILAHRSQLYMRLISYEEENLTIVEISKITGIPVCSIKVLKDNMRRIGYEAV